MKDIEFKEELVRNYPKSTKKMLIDVSEFSIQNKETDQQDKQQVKKQTTFISPYGLEFQGLECFSNGALVKIKLPIPQYWDRKKNM